MINFFASWCAPCKEEATGFTKAERQFAGRVQFLSIARDSPMSGMHGYVSTATASPGRSSTTTATR